jgi:hypothetical protein
LTARLSTQHSAREEISLCNDVLVPLICINYDSPCYLLGRAPGTAVIEIFKSAT